MLVPENADQPPPGTDESTSTPGAATSGLSLNEIVVGPDGRELGVRSRRRAAGDLHGADRDRSFRVGRRRDGARAEIVVVVSGGDHRHYAGCGCGIERSCHDVAAGLDLRLAAREVDHVHPVRDGGLDGGHDRGRVRVGAQPGARLDEHLVVPEVRTWRDARDPSASSRRSVGVPRRDPRDVRAVAGVVVRERDARARGSRALRREDPCDDHLRGREPLLALRKARRHRVAGRVEEGMADVDPRVDDPDLHPLACGVERLAPESGRADLLRCRRQLRRVAAGGENVANTRKGAQSCELGAREGQREPVGDEPVAPADLGGRESLGQLLPEHPLLACDRRVAAWCPCEWRRLEQHHDLGAVHGQRRSTRSEQNGNQRDGKRGESCHLRLRRPEARIGRPRGCGGIGRRARFRSVCP